MPLLKPNPSTPDDGLGTPIRDAWLTHNANADILQALLTASGIPESQANIGATPGHLTDNGTVLAALLELESRDVLPASYTAGLAAGEPIPADELSTAVSKLHAMINRIDAARVIRGDWDISGAAFPSGAIGGGAAGAIQAGDEFVVTNADVNNGTDVDGVNLQNGDTLLAIVDAPSATTYAGQWLKFDNTDRFTQTPPVAADDNTGDVGTSTLLQRSDAKLPLQLRDAGSETTVAITEATVTPGAPTPPALHDWVGKTLHMNYTASAPLTLPDEVDFIEGDRVRLVNLSTFDITITPLAGQSVNGQVDEVYVHSVPHGTVTVERVGTGWAITPEPTLVTQTTGEVTATGNQISPSGAAYPTTVASFEIESSGEYQFTVDVQQSLSISAAGDQGVAGGAMRIGTTSGGNEAFSHDTGRQFYSHTDNYRINDLVTTSYTSPWIHLDKGTYYFRWDVPGALTGGDRTPMLTTAVLKWQGKHSFIAPGTRIAEPARDLLMDATGTTLNGESIPFLNGHTRASIMADYEQVEFWVADLKQGGNNQRNDWPIASHPVEALNPNAAGDGFVRIVEGLQDVHIADAGLQTTGLTFGANNNDGVYVLKMWGVRKQYNAIDARDAALPESFVDHGIWTGVSLQTLVGNGMIIGNGTGAAGTGAPSGAFTGSCKVTAIGDWIQQDFLTANATGTVVGERFSRQSFNGGTTWSAWFGQ